VLQELSQRQLLLRGWLTEPRPIAAPATVVVRQVLFQAWVARQARAGASTLGHGLFTTSADGEHHRARYPAARTRTAPVLVCLYDAVQGARGAEQRRVCQSRHGAEHQRMGSTFIVTSAAGVHRDQAKGTREQPYWDEHTAFIDQLVEEGFIVLGGPLPDVGGAVLLVRADSAAAVRKRLRRDPWYVLGILALQSVRRWEIFIDRWVGSGP
jgi:uncharacterized protein YciI